LLTAKASRKRSRGCLRRTAAGRSYRPVGFCSLWCNLRTRCVRCSQ